MKTLQATTKRPRGRPVSFDRDKVLDAAVLVFWEKGYDGASIDDLTEAMGIKKPSLYAAFGNKRQLFDAAIDRYAATRGIREFSTLHIKQDTRSAVADFFEMSVRCATERGKPRGCMIANVATDAAESDKQLRKKLAVMFIQTDEGIANRFRADQEKGNAPPGHDPIVLAQMVHSVVHSIKTRARAGASRKELLEIANNFVAVLFP
jgi:AcrR family transcriptional regulator